MPAENKMNLRIITPERVFFEEPVEMVEFNTTEGEVGIYPGHIPLTVIVKSGVLTITEDGSKKKAALHAGFAEILQDRVTILAEIIEWPDEIDESRATKARERAEERLKSNSPEVDTLRAEMALYKALTRIQVLKG